MMIDKTKTKKFIFVVGEIEENDLFYHKNNLLDILEKAENVIFLNKDTEKGIKDLFIKEKKENLITLEKSDLKNTKGTYGFILFTGYLDAKDEIINKNDKNIYYILNNKLKIEESLEFVCKNNFDKVISHLLPSELPKRISRDTYKFICSSLYHIPCPCVEKIELKKVQDNNIIFIYDNNSKHFREFEKVYQELNKNDIIVLLDIDDLNFNNFCSNNGFINNKSKIVLLDVNAHERLFLINFCLNNGLPISTNIENKLYDREIINLIYEGIIESDIKTSDSVRSKFNLLFDFKYSSFTRSDKCNINNLDLKFLDNFEYVFNNKYFHLNIGKKYLQLIDTRINELESLINNPLSFQSTDTNDSLFFVSFLLEEQDNYHFSDIIFYKFYYILLERLIKEENNWFTYNIIIRFIHLRPNIYFDVLKTFFGKNKKSKKLEIILKLSVVSLSNIDIDQFTVENVLHLLTNLKNYNSLVLYLHATFGLENSVCIEKFNREEITQSIFDLVSYNLILNESQIKFMKTAIETGTNFEFSNINDVYTTFVKGLIENKPFDLNLLSNEKPLLYKLFNNNPYHLFRLFTTAWINNNNEIANDLLNHFDPKSFDKNQFFSVMYQSILQLAHKPISIDFIETNFFINHHYNQIRKIFHLKVLSYNNDIKFDFNRLFEAHNFKFLPRINNILDNHFSKSFDD